MSETTIIATIMGFTLLIIWSMFLWDLSQSRKTTGKRNFYLLLFTPFILALIYGVIFLSNYALVIISYPWYLIIGLIFLLILYLGFWAVMLYDAGGTEKLAWFILLLIPTPLWLLYWVIDYGR